MTNARKEKILEAFKQTFPGVWVKPGEEFAGCKNAVLWSGESAMIVEEYTDPDTGEVETYDVPGFDYYAVDPQEKTYIMGVHKRLVAFADKFGLYWEAYDAGTYIAYPV